MSPNKRRESVPSSLDLCYDVYDDTFCANAYLLGRLVYMGHTISPYLLMLYRARIF